MEGRSFVATLLWMTANGECWKWIFSEAVGWWWVDDKNVEH
jgi:hypothetical protein